MVHQLSLVSSIPHNQYGQTVSTLQALTGLLFPQPIATYTLITKPHNVFKPKFEPGKVNQIEQYFMKCITTWTDQTSEKLNIAKPVVKDGENDDILVDKLFGGDVGPRRNWTLQISDIPIAGKNQACSAQTIFESTLVHTHTTVKHIEEVSGKDEAEGNETAREGNEDSTSEGNKESTSEGNKESTSEAKEDTTTQHGDNPTEDVDMDSNTQEPLKIIESHNRKDSFLQFVEELGYDIVNQYWIKGIRFFHGDIVIEIFKVLVRDDTVETTANGKIKLKLLDESNTFQIKTYINIPKATDVELINQGTKDLLRLQEFLKNLFQLEIPDRMFMDSRVPVKDK